MSRKLQILRMLCLSIPEINHLRRIAVLGGGERRLLLSFFPILIIAFRNNSPPFSVVGLFALDGMV